MEKDKILEQILQKLPNTTITYEQKPNAILNASYILTAKGYKKLYLNNVELPDLTQEEQIILLAARSMDIYNTPKNTLAGIFKSREILKRSADKEEAIQKINQILLRANRAEFEQRTAITEEVEKRNIRANMLDAYLKAEKRMSEYKRQQKSVFAPLINFKNRILETVTHKPHVGPPHTAEELEHGKREWEKFRKEQGVKDDVPAEKVLKMYRYKGNKIGKAAFSYLYDVPELSSISAEYATNLVALQIIDGSAYKKAIDDINQNQFHYLVKLKSPEASR